nr:hypothetical protein B0A51_13489 [Rachicladosporium sp. CCFEE 5018]
MCVIGTPVYTCTHLGTTSFTPSTGPCLRAQALACPSQTCGYAFDVGCYNLPRLCPACEHGRPGATLGMRGAQGMSLVGMLCALESLVGSRKPTSVVVAEKKVRGTKAGKVGGDRGATPPGTRRATVGTADAAASLHLASYVSRGSPAGSGSLERVPGEGCPDLGDLDKSLRSKDFD